jgi:hypothetical protein
MNLAPAIVISLSVLCAAPAAFACSCASNDTPFATVAKNSDLVVRGKVLELGSYAPGRRSDSYPNGLPMTMTLAVQEIYKGKLNSKQIKIQGGEGLSCRPYLSEFSTGTEWVLAISTIKDAQYGKKGELTLFNCGEYRLPVEKDAVKGRINSKNKPQMMKLSDLRKLLSP